MTNLISAFLRTLCARRSEIAARRPFTVFAMLIALAHAGVAQADFRLPAGGTLYQGQSLESPGGRYVLTLEGSGNLVLRVEGYQIWQTNTPGADRLEMQAGDGNLVMYQGGTARWQTNTASGANAGSYLEMQDDGNVVLNRASGSTLTGVTNTAGGHPPSWWLGRNGWLPTGGELTRGTYRLRNQENGDVALIVDGWYRLWGTGAGAPGWMAMQDDGNLVQYRQDGTVWASWTNGNYGAHLEIDSTGEMIIKDAGGTPIWYSGTGGSQSAPPPKITINGVSDSSQQALQVLPGGQIPGFVENVPATSGYALELYELGGCCDVNDRKASPFYLTQHDQSFTFTAPTYAANFQVFLVTTGAVRSEVLIGPRVFVQPVPTLTIQGGTPSTVINGQNMFLNVAYPVTTPDSWVGLFEMGAGAASPPLVKRYWNGSEQRPGSGPTSTPITVAIPATAPGGKYYEFRYYASDTATAPLQSTQVFWVKVRPPQVTIDGLSYGAAPIVKYKGTSVTVHVSGVAPGGRYWIEMLKENLWTANPQLYYWTSNDLPAGDSDTIFDLGTHNATEYPLYVYVVGIDQNNNDEVLSRGPDLFIKTPVQTTTTLTINGVGYPGPAYVAPGTPFDAIVKNGPNGANDRVVIGSVTQFSSFVVDAITRRASFAGLPEGTYPTRFETCNGNFTCTFVVNGPTLEVGPLLKVTVNDVGPEAQQVSVDPGAAITLKVVGPGNVYANDRVVLVRQANNAVTSYPLGGQRETSGAAPGDKDIYFVYLMSAGSNQGGTEVIAASGPNVRVGKGLDGVDTRYYYDTDAIGSVRLITGAAGAVEARKDFLPFGSGWATTTSTAQGDRIGFSGKERDSETSLEYSAARYLAANLGRFLSADSSVFADPGNPQSWNVYSYSFNNPLRFFDPSGKVPCEVQESPTDASSGICEKPDPYETKIPPLTNFRYNLFAGKTSPEVTVQPLQDPTACTMDQNIKTAYRLRLDTMMALVNGDWTAFTSRVFAFPSLVGNRMPWDFKQQRPGDAALENYGNMHFGAVGRAFGLPGEVLLWGAGGAQTVAGTSRIEWGSPWKFKRPYGDDPNDQKWIQVGIDYYNRVGTAGTFCR
jgi:RHS repeat-associated protein